MKSEQEIRERIIILNKARNHSQEQRGTDILWGEVLSLKWVIGEES